MRNLYRCLTVLAVLLSFTACRMSTLPDRPEVHGHRGCRALVPENTIAGFLHAAELGVEHLEMDVVVSADGEVVVSHEPWMDHRICLTEEGERITASQERSHNIYRMDLGQVQSYDCGSLAHPDFPAQNTAPAYKPTLDEVVNAVEQGAAMNGWGNQSYNIEIKSDPALYRSMQPMPAELARIVLEKIDALGIADRCILQSFDPAVLIAVREIDDDIPLALLVENDLGAKANLARLPFVPEYYSADLRLVDSTVVDFLRKQDVLPLVWTVNDTADMQRMIRLGVDGIITDRPDVLMRILDELY